MATTRSPYPPEFRAEAVRLVLEGGRSPQQLAQDLGCSHRSILYWLAQAERDAGQRGDGLTSTDRAELRQLRREVRVLRMERELLKKAAAFFAKESNPTR